VHKSVMMELKRVIEDSEIMEEDDALWPPPDRVGRQVSSLVCCQSVIITLVFSMMLLARDVRKTEIRFGFGFQKPNHPKI